MSCIAIAPWLTKKTDFQRRPTITGNKLNLSTYKCFNHNYHSREISFSFLWQKYKKKNISKLAWLTHLSGVAGWSVDVCNPGVRLTWTWCPDGLPTNSAEQLKHPAWSFEVKFDKRTESHYRSEITSLQPEGRAFTSTPVIFHVVWSSSCWHHVGVCVSGGWGWRGRACNCHGYRIVFYPHNKKQ